ncbi:hypothetical protein H2198_004965 [Neophaeococcomyces mojaviensis]|uniref:Uncharacterized protein n=1 Tax=Neophaeococcomyces mojaviensis TaxID=3383035 RepID=A0ACC3A704_9EURO|nr:hypothetical protein H2198_004965 [Knufia sp. JES_112]
MQDAFLQNQTFAANAQDRVSGWVDQPNFRGTFDIICTCITTIFICTYSMLVLNIPAPKDKELRIVGRRILWMAIGILGPEFPLTYAAGQWSRACQSVTAFNASKEYQGWTMRHAFFADMGGFVLHARESAPFPLNAKQLHWLVVNKKVEYPEISDKELWDKSKQDRIVKLIMAIQTTYFVLQCIGRAIQQLAITTLELNTLAIVVCSLMTSFVWLHKSADVRIPIIVKSAFTIEEIIGNRTWKLTPLDFVDENGPGYSVNVQPFMKMPVIRPERPIQMIPNDRFPTNPHGAQEYFLCFATLVYTGLHLTAWNFPFPSHIERILWRTSSLLLFGITVAFWILETMASWMRLERWERFYLHLTDRKKLPQFEAELLRRRQTENRVPAQLPQLWEFCAITPLALLYGLGRMYMIVEAFLEFRNMPATAYMTVEWSEYLPHI